MSRSGWLTLSQMIWDLDYLGGSDRAEAAGELRTWLLARH